MQREKLYFVSCRTFYAASPAWIFSFFAETLGDKKIKQTLIYTSKKIIFFVTAEIHRSEFCFSLKTKKYRIKLSCAS